MKVFDENEAVETLRMIGVSASHEKIIERLRKHNFDIERTASELLNAQDSSSSGANDDDIPPLISSEDLEREKENVMPTASTSSVTFAPPPPPTPKVRVNDIPLIDLTRDDEDEDLRKALSLSLGENINSGNGKERENTPVFGPSSREDPGQNWAMVTVSQQTSTATAIAPHDPDADLRRALDESMKMELTEDYMAADFKWRGAATWEKYLKDSPTSDWAEPAALMTQDTDRIYATHLLHALFAVPQLRSSVKAIFFPREETHIHWKLNDLNQVFTILEHTQRSWVDATTQMAAIGIIEGAPRIEPPLPSTGKLLDALTQLVSVVTIPTNQSKSNSPSVDTDSSASSLPVPPKIPFPSLFDKTVSVSSEHNDIYSALSAYFEVSTEKSSDEADMPQGTPSNSSASTVNNGKGDLSESTVAQAANEQPRKEVAITHDDSAPSTGMDSGFAATIHTAAGNKPPASASQRPSSAYISASNDILVIRLSRDHSTSPSTSAAVHPPFIGPSIGPQQQPLATAIASALNPESSNISAQHTHKEPFTFPAVLHADLWAQDEKSAKRRKLLSEDNSNRKSRIREALSRLGLLVGPKEKPNLPILKASLHYAENIASAETEERKEKHSMAAKKLQAVIASLEKQIDETRETIRVDAEALKQAITPAGGDDHYKYHLRAVLMHDGQYSLKSLYSYVCAPNGKWWKITLDEVVEVAEDVVLNDRAGLFMNAGPYMLLYSKEPSSSSSETVLTSAVSAAGVPPIVASKPWPQPMRSRVLADNRNFRGEHLHKLASDPSTPWPYNGLSMEEFEVLDPLARMPDMMVFDDDAEDEDVVDHDLELGLDRESPTVSASVSRETTPEPVPAPSTSSVVAAGMSVPDVIMGEADTGSSGSVAAIPSSNASSSNTTETP